MSPQEVSNALKELVPRAKGFLERPIGERRFKYLYVDGTNFRVRRTTVDREPTLVVIGVDESDHKSVLSMVQGDKDHRDTEKRVPQQAHTSRRGPSTRRGPRVPRRYHNERNHQALDSQLIVPPANLNRSGPLVCWERLGGLLRFHDREAA